MMFRIRFNLLGGCFACNCSAAVFSRSCRIGSGIHFRAVGLLTPSSFAHLDTLPPGCSLYQVSTCLCCVGAPLRFMFGLSLVNLAIVLTSCLLFFLVYHAAALLSSYFPVIFHVKKLKITENTPRRRSGRYISTAGRGKTSLSRSFSLITAAGFHRQQKGHLPGTHGGTLRGRCPASGVNQPR